MDQVKTDEEIERNKTKRPTYSIRTVSYSWKKILIIIKIIKTILTIKVIVIMTIMITIIMKCKGRYRTPTTTNNGASCEITKWPKAFK